MGLTQNFGDLFKQSVKKNGEEEKAKGDAEKLMGGGDSRKPEVNKPSFVSAEKTLDGGKQEMGDDLSDEMYDQIEQIAKAQDDLREEWAKVAIDFLENHRNNPNFRKIITEFSLQLMENNQHRDQFVLGIMFANLLEDVIKRNKQSK